MCAGGLGSQIFKQNWIISIRSRVIVIIPIWVSSALGGGAGGWGVLGWSALIYMSSGMFRGKESSNNRIISISSRLIEFWCFGLPAALGVGVVGGCPHTCAHAHMVNMIISWKIAAPIGGIPGNSLWCHMRVHACVHVHVHMGWVHPLTTPTPIHPPPTPQGDPWNHSKFNSTWTNQDISISTWVGV